MFFCWAAASAQTETSADELDFDYEGITYTVIDSEAKTCRTKSGSSYIINSDSPRLITTYANHITGDVTIPSFVIRTLDEGVIENFTVVAIGDYAFDQLTSISIPETVTSIGLGAFSNCPTLKRVNMGNNVTTIGSHAFTYCTQLVELSLSESLTAIPPNMIANCPLIKNINIPNTVTSIGDYAFSHCSSLESIVIPNAVNQIGINAFQSCNMLNSVTLPENLNALPAYVFYGCPQLKSITLPSSITSIGTSAFANCISLNEVFCYAKSLPAISVNTFSAETFNNGTLNIYNSVIPVYLKSPIWGSFSSIKPIYVAPTGIILDKKSVAMTLGYNQQIQAKLEPVDALGEITWSAISTPENAVIVNQSGLVTAQRTGTATVTANCGNLKASCPISIYPNPKESVTISPIGNPVYVGDQLPMSAVVIPTTITSPITWASSNPEVASIDATSGLLEAHAPGGALITATCEGINGKLSVTVNPIPVESISLKPASTNLKVTENTVIYSTILPENATYKTISWETSDPTVAIVADGMVTAVGVGSCTIRATSGDVIANCDITVDPTPTESITLSTSQLVLKPNQSSVLSATILPVTATDKTVIWVSSNPEIANVDLNGTVTALGVGNVTITATCSDVSAACNVVVEPILAEEVILNYNSITLVVNQSQQLTASVAENVTDKTISWTSSDESVATVKDGFVTAVNEGTAIITATNGNIYSSCMVTVKQIPIESLSFSSDKLVEFVGKTNSPLFVSYYPEEASQSQIYWYTSDPSIISLEGSQGWRGNLTILAPGTVTIVAYTLDGVYTSITITVEQACQSISLNHSNLVMNLGDMVDLIATLYPANTTEKLTWQSMDSKVATVNDHGIVQAQGIGYTSIVVTCGTQAVVVNVQVKSIEADAIELNASNLNLKVSESFKFNPVISPANVTYPSIYYHAEPADILKLSSDFTITAVKAGTAKVIFECGETMAECFVTVTQPESKELLMNYNQLTLHATETFQLSATMGGEDGNYAFTWTSDNPRVASVDSKGLVTAEKPGKAVITATFEGEATQCVVTVEPTEASLVMLDWTTLNLQPGDNTTLLASVYPENTTDKTVIWTSDNNEVASVDKNGKVTAIKEGYSVITALCGNVFAQCVVTVTTEPLPEEPGNNGGNDNNGGNNNNAIEDITTEDTIYNVYTINGIKVLSTKERSDILKLSNGLYIINGQKVYIRK